MSDKEKKYLEDEQVRKNLDSFKNDRENFMNNSEMLDILGIDYGKNKTSVRFKKRVREKLEKEKLKVVNNSADSDKDNIESDVWIPITLSVIIVFLICLRTYIGYGDGSGYNGLSLLFLWGIPFCLVIIWISYGLISSVKSVKTIETVEKGFVKKKKSGCGIGLMMFFVALFSLIAFPFVLSFIFSH